MSFTASSAGSSTTTDVRSGSSATRRRRRRACAPSRLPKRPRDAEDEDPYEGLTLIRSRRPARPAPVGSARSRAGVPQGRYPGRHGHRRPAEHGPRHRRGGGACRRRGRGGRDHRKGDEADEGSLQEGQAAHSEDTDLRAVRPRAETRPDRGLSGSRQGRGDDPATA